MRRRTFLALMGALAAGLPARPAAAQSERAIWWRPQPLSLARPVVLEWRYLAARVTLGGADSGFVVSLASYNEVPNPSPPPAVLQQPRYELLVARQEFSGARSHISALYSRPNTTPTFSDNTYSFAAGAAGATWQLRDDGTYGLNVASPELTLSGLTLRPLTPFVSEDGDGEITVARFSPAFVNSDYHSDWVAVEQAGQLIGYGRLDMQTLRPTAIARPTAFSHHWFALAGHAGADEVWLSAYELISEETFWYCTLGRRSQSGAWSVEHFSHATAGIAHPLRVQIDWQPQLGQDGRPVTPARRTGKRWRVSLGRDTPGDTLDLDLEVPPGQFLQGARIAGVITGRAIQELLGTSARGLVGGAGLADVRFTVAESTFSEPGEPLTPPRKLHLPLARH